MILDEIAEKARVRVAESKRGFLGCDGRKSETKSKSDRAVSL